MSEDPNTMDAEQVQRDEHARISNVGGKKTFILDGSGNQIIDFVNPTANITVEQGSDPWNTSIQGNVTVEQGDNPWKSQITDGVDDADVVENEDQDTNIDGTKGLVVAAGMYARSSATILKPVAFDVSTHALTVMDYEHHEIHGGSHYFLADYVTLGDGDVADFCVKTPDSPKWAHLLFGVQTTGEVEINVYEGVTNSGGGATITPMNNNRNSDNTSGLLIKSNCSITALGTKISGQILGVAGTPVTTGGGNTKREDELILKRNTDYLIRMESGSATNNVSYRASWYEHTNKA